MRSCYKKKIARVSFVLAIATALPCASASEDTCPPGQPGPVSPARRKEAAALHRRAEQFFNADDRAAARATLQRAEALLGGVYSQELSAILSLQAEIDKSQDLARARIAQLRALDIDRCLGGPTSNDLIVDYQILSEIEDALREPEAIPHARDAVALCDRLPRVEDRPADCADARNVLAILLQRQGDFDEAAVLFQQAIAEGKLLRKEKVPVYLQNLATLRNETGALEEAVRLLEEVRQSLADSSPDLPTIVANLAAAYETLGDWQARTGNRAKAEATYKNAEATYQTARDVASKTPAGGHARLLSNYAGFLRNRGQFGEAETSNQEALRLIKPATHPQITAEVRYQLSRLYGAQERYQEALAMHQAALALLDPRDGRKPSDWTPNSLLLELLTKGARLHEKLGQTREALAKLDAALLISERQLELVGRVMGGGRVQQFSEVIADSEELIYELVAAHPEDANLVALGLRAVLLRKDRQQEEAAAQNHLLGRLGEEGRRKLKRVNYHRQSRWLVKREPPKAV